MADPNALKDQILAVLRALPHLGGRIYDGVIVGSIPVDGYANALPYVVLFAGTGNHPDEQYTNGTTGTDGLIFDFQTNCVGPTASHATAVAVDVRVALTNLRIGTGRVKPNPDGFEQSVPYREESNTPVRLLLPQQWRLKTN
jgi:hypothetical protein